MKLYQLKVLLYGIDSGYSLIWIMLLRNLAKPNYFSKYKNLGPGLLSEVNGVIVYAHIRSQSYLKGSLFLSVEQKVEIMDKLNGGKELQSAVSKNMVL